jgi:hypothetical protein
VRLKQYASALPVSAIRAPFLAGPSSTSPRCFCCFCRKLSATDRSFAAGILDQRRRSGQENSGITHYAWRSVFPLTQVQISRAAWLRDAGWARKEPLIFHNELQK